MNEIENLSLYARSIEQRGEIVFLRTGQISYCSGMFFSFQVENGRDEHTGTIQQSLHEISHLRFVHPKILVLFCWTLTIGLHQPLDGVTNSKYKL